MKKYREEYVKINGKEHYLMHYFNHEEHPVMLFLHGGPGQSESIMSYVSDDFDERTYTMVYYDQRSAGRTRQRNKKDVPTMEELQADLLEIVLYLKKLYHKEKIIILAHSWGTVLGSIFALEHPQHLLAYIGSGQLIDMQENEQDAYQQLKTAILEKNNQKDMKKLMNLGDYPDKFYSALAYKKMGKMRQLQGKYGLGMKIDKKMISIVLHSPVMKIADIVSFIMPNHTADHLMEYLFEYSLRNHGYTYQIPIYYVLGDRDQQTPYAIAMQYFDNIIAPAKKLYLLPDTGHLMMIDNPQAYRKALLEIAHTCNHENTVKP